MEPDVLWARQLERKVAVTPIVGWGGEVAARLLRFVSSDEPVERPALLVGRLQAALAAARARF